MTPKEKAESIIKVVGLYANDGAILTSDMCTKQLAYIVCYSHLYSENDSPFATIEEWKNDNQYWWHVKEEINKLIP